MFDFWPAWKILGRQPAARRRPAVRLGQDAEGLESRCLLSASRGRCAVDLTADVSTESDQKPIKEPHGARKQTIPVLPTNWGLTTDPGGSNIHGVLQFEQHGKRLTGTLTNVQQPPGSFKVRLKMARDRDIGWTITGTCLNRAVASVACKISGTVSDQNPNDGNAVDFMSGRFTPRGNDGEPANFTATTAIG